LNYPITDSVIRWLEVIFAERFGHAWQLSRTSKGLRFQLAGIEGAIVFDKLEDGLTQAHSDQSCAWWDASSEGWHSALGGSLPAPGVAELPAPLIETRSGEHIIHYDILGLTYWMLARVEEIGRTDLDNHERFPASSSHAYKHGYLDHPVVDEWLHVLGQVIERQWPGVELKRHEFQIQVSHDVDQPSLYTFKPWKTIVRMMAGHILKRCNPKAFITAPYVKLATRNALIDADPYNTFDWLMDASEANGLRSAFYFICGRTHPSKDADYEIEHPVMRDLLRRIHWRGHEIGLHPSYNTFRDPAALKREVDRLKRVCAEEGIEQERWGGRMHILRWDSQTTFEAVEKAGLDYDTTITYADSPGFRSGTCFTYTAFSAINNVTLKIKITPLIAMECSVIDPLYMNQGFSSDAINTFLKFKKKCKRINGTFTLLWHNSYFPNDQSKKIYEKVIENARFK